MITNNFQAFTSAITRIYHPKGEVVGAGFLTSPEYVLTCAHVVAEALGISSETSEVSEESTVDVDFPLITPGNKQKARVRFWLPSQTLSESPPEKGEDVAVLELLSLPLEGGRQVQPAPIVLAEDRELWEHLFRVFGFPWEHDNGVWATGELDGEQAWKWVQIEALKVPGYQIEPGFSGSPVWDKKLAGVVGIVTAAEKRRKDVKAAYMISTKRLKEWIPDRFFLSGRATVSTIVNPDLWPIIDAFAYGEDIVPFLGPGINLCDFSPPVNLIELASILVKNYSNTGILLGLPCLGVPSAVCPLPPNEWPPPINCPFWKKASEENILAQSNYQKLALSKVNLRLVSQYVSYQYGENLYGRLRQFWHDYYEQFKDGSRLRRIHDFFANLPSKMQQKGSRKLPYKLIVTTNFDETLEQAFDDAGQQGKYDVVFYVAEGNDNERGHFKHKDNKGEVHTIPFNDDYELPIGERPIILKLYGTWKHEFVITEEHHVTYLVEHSIEEVLPATVRNLLTKKSKILFLGYSPYDSDLLIVLHRFWKNQPLPKSKLRSIQSWLVHKSEPGRLEKRLLRDRAIEAIEMQLADFITNLEMGIEEFHFT